MTIAKASIIYGTVKIHFKSSRRAIEASAFDSATAGHRTTSGKITTWIAHVSKATPNETAEQAYARLMLR